MISFHPPVFHPLIVFLPLAAHHFISFTQFQLEKKTASAQPALRFRGFIRPTWSAKTKKNQGKSRSGENAPYFNPIKGENCLR